MLALTSGLLSVEEHPLSITHAASAAPYNLYFIIYIKSFWTEYLVWAAKRAKKRHIGNFSQPLNKQTPDITNTGVRIFR
jgi:hypothetical protein